MASDFLQRLEAQPWFQNVAQAFANDKVPAPLWEATVAVEDPSLNPYAVNYGTPQNPEESHGLFQVNIYGNLASDPARVQAALGTPDAQAQWAAGQMAQALASSNATDLPSQLQAIEKWAWPGNLSEDTQRQAALQDVLSQSGSSTGGGNIWNPSDPNNIYDPKHWHYLDPTKGSNWAPAANGALGPVADAINAFTGSMKTIAVSIAFGALGLGLLAAGGVILAGNSNTTQAAAKAAVLA